MPKRKKVMVVDHDPEVVRILEVNLSHANLDVISANSGAQALSKAHDESPDIILLDVVLPDREGLEICRLLKESQQTSHIPIVITGTDGKGEEVTRDIFNIADHYIIKPFDPNEVVALVETYFRQIERENNINPLTNLPNQIQVKNEIVSLIEQNRKFSAIYIDIDNLKAFNRAYDFERGDSALQLLADILREAIRLFGNPDDLVGHLGGDNFIIITSIQKTRGICQRIITDFDSRIRTLYDPKDVNKGYIEYEGQSGEAEQCPIMTISAAAVTNERRSFHHPLQISETAAEFLDDLSHIPGSNYYLDRSEDDSGTQLGLQTKGIPHACREEMRTLQRVLSWVSFLTEEIEAPVSVIKDCLESLEAAQDSTESRYWHSLNAVRDNAEHLLHVVQELSYITRSDWLIGDNTLEEIDVRTTLEWIMGQVQKLAEQRSIEINMETTDGVGRLMVDVRTLTRSLFYLIRSEINASAPGDQLRVSIAEISDTSVIIELTNYNQYIPQCELAKLFQGQMNGLIQNELGNNLYLTKVLVHGIGGDINVHSDDKEGTTFIITVPRRWQGSMERINSILAATETSRKEVQSHLEDLHNFLSRNGETPSAIKDNLGNLGHKVQELVVLCNRSLFLADEVSSRLESKEDQLLLQEVEQLATLEAMQIISREIATSVQAGFLFDPESARRVAKNASLIASEFRLLRNERQALHHAALLKDLGFVSCPEDILEHGVASTIEEAVNISKPFNILWKVLSRLNFLSPALDIIWHRCERYDGTGHPFGVKGTNIPLGARILAVVDTFDAMTSGRPYKETLTPEVALQKLSSDSGQHFDPAVVNALLRTSRKKEFQVAPTWTNKEERTS